MTAVSPVVPAGHTATIRRYDTGTDLTTHVTLLGHVAWLSTLDPEIRRLAVALETGRGLEQGPTGKRVFRLWTPRREYYLEVPRTGPVRRRGELFDVCWAFMRANVGYATEKGETFRDARSNLAMGKRPGIDCFTLDTKVIVRSRASGCYEVRSLGYLRGVWPAFDALTYDFSAGAFTFKPITAWQHKGVREVWQTKLDNGPPFRHTPDHRVWWWDGQGSRRVAERELASRLGDADRTRRRVLVARKIPALAATDLSRAKAYLSGIYAAEGYASRDQKSHIRNRVFIAQDRDDVRARIEVALNELGVGYRSSPPQRTRHRYYNLHSDDSVRSWLLRQGSGSFDMRIGAEVLGGTEDVVRTALEAHGDGDAYRPQPGSGWYDKVTAIHATSSEDLAAELQLCAMILGEAWHTQRQQRHGGSGTRPMFRVHRYREEREPSRRWVPELPGVGYSCAHEPTFAGEDEVADISVADTHNFVLANGMIAHNCDDHVVTWTSILARMGFRVGCEVISTDGKEWEHVYAIALDGGVWVPLDTAAPDYASVARPGWRYPHPAAVQQYEFSPRPEIHPAPPGYRAMVGGQTLAGVGVLATDPDRWDLLVEGENGEPTVARMMRGFRGILTT